MNLGAVFHNLTSSPPGMGGLGTTPPHAFPFYFAPRQNLVGGISDSLVAMLLPGISYWFVSLAYTFLDYTEWKWLDPYRIHEPEEIKSRNLVTRTRVIIGVFSIQAMQVLITLMIPDHIPAFSDAQYARESEAMKSALLRFAQQAFIPTLLGSALTSHEGEIAYWLYWWIAPAARFMLGW